MDLNRIRELAGLTPDTEAGIFEAAKVGGYQRNFKNPAAKKRTGETQVAETEDYVVFHNRSFDEFRAVLKKGTKADGEMKTTKAAAITAIEAAKDSLEARFAKVEKEDDGDEYGNQARRKKDDSAGQGGRYARNTADGQSDNTTTRSDKG